ncbi:MAG: hypothetical protein JNK34_02030 [Tabrizicola sp.]|nr:hypothetical protein [Tabrizicola sp.]
MKKPLLALLAGFLLSGLVQTEVEAQEVVGKAIVDGKTVSLYADKTWTFDVATSSAGCSQITAKLSFCGDAERWRPSPNANAIINATYSLNASTYGLMIVEDIGTSVGISSELLRNTILKMAGTQSDSQPVVLGIESDTFQDKDLETLVYQVSINGLKIVFATTMYLTAGTTAQISTYEIGETYSEAHKAAHEDFLAATRIVE